MGRHGDPPSSDHVSEVREGRGDVGAVRRGHTSLLQSTDELLRSHQLQRM